VNADLLDKIGTDKGGISDYIQPKEDLEVKVSNFFARVSSPVLSDLELDLGPVQAETMYPRKIGDLFKGMQAVIIGRYKNDGDLNNIAIQLRGKASKENRTFAYHNLDFPLRNESNDFLPRLWASRRVGWLVEEMRNNGETKELKDEVVELGTRYGIVTPYTSYLATDGSFQVNARDARGLVNMAPGAAAKMAERSGGDSVRMSVQQNRMKSNASISLDGADDSEQQVLVRNTDKDRYISNRSFFRQGNVWVDSDFKTDRKLPETTIKFASEEYYALAAKEKGIAQFLALGEEVVVVWKDRVYRVIR